MFVIKISETCFQAVSSSRVTSHNLHRLILDGPERSIVRDFLKITQLYPLPSPGVQYPPSKLSCAITCKPFRHSPPVFLEKCRSRFVVELTVFIEFLKLEKMLRQRKIHLFNCDQLYELSIIEDLLNSSKPKLAFDFTVECHYFSLSESLN